MSSETNFKPTVHAFQLCNTVTNQADEINLIDMWRVLVRRRNLIISITLLVSLFSVGIALILPRAYQAEVVLLPPLASDIEKLNIPGINETNPGDVYAETIENLESLYLRRSYFDDHKLYNFLRSPRKADVSENMIFMEKFHKSLSVQIKKNKNPGSVRVTFEGKKPELIAKWLNEFIHEVGLFTAAELVTTITNKIEYKKEILLNKIASLKNIAKVERNDEIAKLREKSLLERNIVIDEIKTLKNKAAKIRLDNLALLRENITIAKDLGIIEQSPLLIESRPENSSSQSDKESNVLFPALYNRGVAALKAEEQILLDRKSDELFVQGLRALERKLELLETDEAAEILASRKNDEPFISGLRDIERQIDELDRIKLFAEDIRVMRVDQAALIPVSPIKPKRKIIVIIGFLLGLSLAISCAFLINYIENNLNKIRACKEKREGDDPLEIASDFHKS